ncbi:MAG TPA: hypothetical protein VFM68_01490 [Candidatus Saccharimonadales bacterium]|nr:hypothetical protein [Candidatus Saccharimonadales bacterium]
MIGDPTIYKPDVLILKLQEERKILAGTYLGRDRMTAVAIDVQRAAFELWYNHKQLSDKEFEKVKQECTPYLPPPKAKKQSVPAHV